MMQESRAMLLDQQRFERWASFTVGAAQLAAAQPGQFVGLRCTPANSYDPLLRQPLFVVAADPRAKTCTLLASDLDPAYDFLNRQPRGTVLDLIGPLGRGWNLAATVRTLALIGTAAQAPALFALAHSAIARGLAVALSIVAAADGEAIAAPPPFLLPAAAEYHIVQDDDLAQAGLALLDDTLLRWADLLAIALPAELLPEVAQRVRQVRLQWNRDFAQVALLGTARHQIACCVGVCGVCGIEARHGRKLLCSDGPIFDLRDLVR
jgi:dihydroorotate dehydrogenase electron transfer subunit